MDPKPRAAERYFYSAFDTYDRQRAEKLFALLKKNNTWQVPTLVEERSSWTLQGDKRLTDERMRYIPEVTLNSWDTLLGGIAGGRTSDDLAAGEKFVERELELVRDMHRAGIKFLAGTDAPAQAYVFPGFGIHEELELLVQAGLTPMQALQAATRNSAEFLGLLGSLGTIENGKTANLVLLDANPLDNIRNTRTIAAVVAHGRYLSKATLDHMLAEAQAAASRAH
jgi:imidazolonepropionase-like amidohydrolase